MSDDIEKADVHIHLTEVPGLGDDWADRMRGIGIESAQDLAEADAEEIAELGTVEEWRIQQWIDDAGEIVEEVSESRKSASKKIANQFSESRASARDRGAESVSVPSPVPESEDDFEQLWERLTHNQKKVAQEYLFCSSKADAAREVGLTPSAVYAWPDYVWEASSILLDRRKSGLAEGMSALSPKALDVLRRALDPDEAVSRTEAESAQYLVNQLEGKPTQKNEVEVEGGIDVSDSDKEALDDALSHLGGD